jgi:cell shape-determining protein MreC
MKKTYLARRNALLSPANVSWGTLALLVAVLLLLIRLILPNFFWYLFTPAFRASDALTQTSHTLLSSFGNAATLTAQNEKLTNANAVLVAENEALLEKSNDVAGLTTTPQGILAGVVARPPESPYDTLVVAAGSAEGVTRGMEAFGVGTVPLGTVSSVLTHLSRITLFSTPGESLLGWVGSKHLPLNIVGSGGGTISAVVSRSADIAIGDTVSAPGPGSLPIGQVIRVDSDPSSPSVTLRIQPLLNLFSVTWVSLRDTGASLKGALSATSSTPLP